MKIIIFAYRSQNPPSTFVKRHIDDIAGGSNNFMQLHEWSTPMLGNTEIWGTSLVSRAIRKIRIKLGETREDLHREAFAKALRRERPGAVLAEFGYSGAHIVGPCRKLGIPLAVHFHGTDVNRRELVEKHIDGYREVFQYAECLIAVSKFEKDKLINLGADPAKISVIPCGAVLPANDLPNKQCTDTFNIISVTRMSEVKAPHLTILAFHKFLQMNGDGHLHLVGDGPLLPFCESLARGLGILDKCIFHGQIDHARTLDLLGTSQMYVQHSVEARDGDCEGMPVSIMEAAGYGLPIVTSSPGGIPEHIIHGLTGLVVEQYDTDSMAQYMYNLSKDNALAMELGRAAKAMAYEQFDATKQSLKIKKLISGC